MKSESVPLSRSRGHSSSAPPRMQMYSSPSGPGPSTPPEFPLISHEKRSRVPRHPAATHSACRGVVLRVMPPRPPDDQLHSPRRRVRSPSRGASKVDVIVGPERTRHIVTPLLRADVARLNVLGSMSACRLVVTAPPPPEPREAQRSFVDFHAPSMKVS